jgi:hypothetical protein
VFDLYRLRAGRSSSHADVLVFGDAARLLLDTARWSTTSRSSTSCTC